jgi:hypothetical protein
VGRSSSSSPRCFGCFARCCWAMTGIIVLSWVHSRRKESQNMRDPRHVLVASTLGNGVRTRQGHEQQAHRAGHLLNNRPFFGAIRDSQSGQQSSDERCMATAASQECGVPIYTVTTTIRCKPVGESPPKSKGLSSGLSEKGRRRAKTNDRPFLAAPQ